MQETLEEKIMGLQRFKKHLADSVVNAQNASLDSMNPDQLLDLFDLSQYAADTPADASGSAPVDEAEAAQSAADAAASGGKRKATGVAALMKDLGELSSAEQYEEEYNLQNFLAGL